MQASPAWTPPAGTLGASSARRDARAAALRRGVEASSSELAADVAAAPRSPRSLRRSRRGRDRRGEAALAVEGLDQSRDQRGGPSAVLRAGRRRGDLRPHGAGSISADRSRTSTAVRERGRVPGAQEGLSRRSDPADRGEGARRVRGAADRPRAAAGPPARDDRRRRGASASRCWSRCATRTSWIARARRSAPTSHRGQQPKPRDTGRSIRPTAEQLIAAHSAARSSRSPRAA